ncbi:MAG: hypothetical protein Q7T49_02210 [bacterium]|nr:hypothetical protein [bacterium]
MIRLLIIIILIVLVLSYFQVDLRGIMESPQSIANFVYLKGLFFDLVAKIWPN